MEKIQVNAEFLFELKSREEWWKKVPGIMPPKKRGAEKWIWLDTNNNVFETGLDFKIAEIQCTYPCKVYRLQSVSAAKYPITENQQPKLSELKIGDHLLCVKHFETGMERFNSVIPDFVKGKKYEIYKIEKSGKYCSVTFRNENGLRHTLTTEYLKEYFEITENNPSADGITETQL